MKRYRVGMICAAACALLPGCAGVPRLYKPARFQPDTTLAPKVEHIVDQITCELAALSKKHLTPQRYAITVLLTLQVNDDLNLTPSLSFIEPLTVATTTRTLTQNLGIGGSRERTFVSNFYFDSAKLVEMEPCPINSKKLYRLDGNLGLAEIARDGIGIARHQAEKSGPPPEPPIFSSNVKFIVTRSVGALGPTWSLLSFKGPGGANGLLNGKALTTDSINIAFVPTKEKKPDPAVERQIALLEQLVRAIEGRERTAVGRIAKGQATIRREDAKAGQLKSLAEKRAIAGLRAEVAAAERERTQAASELAQTQAALDAARSVRQTEASAAAGQSQSDAIDTGRALINLTILQNLNVQPR